MSESKAKENDFSKLPKTEQHLQLSIRVAGATRAILDIDGQMEELRKDREAQVRLQLNAMRQLVQWENDNLSEPPEEQKVHQTEVMSRELVTREN